MKYTLIILTMLFALVAVSFSGCIDQPVDGDEQSESVQTPDQSETQQSVQPEQGVIEPGGTQCGPFTCGFGQHGCNCSCGNARCVPQGIECLAVCL